MSEQVITAEVQDVSVLPKCPDLFCIRYWLRSPNLVAGGFWTLSTNYSSAEGAMAVMGYEPGAQLVRIPGDAV